MQAHELVIKKQKFDADLWVLEIEDLHNTYDLDAPISEF